MIKGFENITFDLTETEKEKFIPILIKGFQGKIASHKTGKDHAITEKYMRLRIEELTKLKTSAPRMRKMLASLVFSDAFPTYVLCSSGKGYYVSDDLQDIADLITSLKERIQSQQAKLSAIEKQYNFIKQ